MKRNEWTFEYTASKLAAAATAKREKHQKRLEWWEAKKAETIKKVSDAGIEVQDSVGAGASNTMRGAGPTIRIDAGLQRDLSECQHKIEAHRDLVSEYSGWMQVFTANPESRLALTHDDYLYFFGE